MTGLSPTKDHILQICCFVTDSQLTLLSPTPYEAAIHVSDPVLSAMDNWCQRTHAETGLTSRVRVSETSIDRAADELLTYIKALVPAPRTGILAGNSVHVDRSFLERGCPEVVKHLNYRILDVSTVKEAVRMWCSEEVWGGVPRKEERHEAKMDILESIEEMRYYKKTLFDGK
jgi:oligoribonuclease